MDLVKIKSVVFNQLTNINGLYSLKLQNHIYGCFIIMEDIAQNTINVSETILSTPKFTFDYDKQFNEIGLRYGFAMDTKLILDTFTPEYKETWLQYFKDINLTRDINEVDKIEDCLIEVIQSQIKPEEEFFINALDTGILPQEWIEKVLNLINPPTTTTATDTATADTTATDTTATADTTATDTTATDTPTTPTDTTTYDKDIDIEKTAISAAITEKPLTRRRLATTRRAKQKTIINKKSLIKTRRRR